MVLDWNVYWIYGYYFVKDSVKIRSLQIQKYAITILIIFFHFFFLDFIIIVIIIIIETAS